jgi:hypothetical protein
MKAKPSRSKAKSTSSPQLDLFSQPARPAVEEVVPREQTIAVCRTHDGEYPSRPVRDPLLDFIFGRPRRRGRPEKQLPDDIEGSDDLVDVREAAMRLGLSKSTLDKMRCSGRGPRFIRATDRAIRYDPKDLKAFADERRRRTTSDLAGLLAD